MYPKMGYINSIKLENFICPKKIDDMQISAPKIRYFFLDFVTFFKKPYPADIQVVNIAPNIHIP